MHDPGTWLESIGLGDCRALLIAHASDEAALRSLKDRDLQRLGLSLGQRRKLLRGIADLATTNPLRLQQPEMAGRDERRQVTIMMCDLVGSTALASRLDPEDLAHVIRTYLQEITATIAGFGGYVARYMGDGVLVYFGWPQAHEDAAEQATRAGLAVVDSVRGLYVNEFYLDVRVGVATGLVVVGDTIGAGASREHVAMGESPNLAARLQSVAEPNTVVVSATTRRLLGQMFDLEPIGPFDFKGVSRLVAAWRVVRERDNESRFKALGLPARNGLVNRQNDLAMLHDLWARTLRGAGQVALLSGEPGVGKTRIAEAFGEELGGVSLWIRFQCLPNRASSALHPIIRALARLANFQLADNEEVRLTKLCGLLGSADLESEDVMSMYASILSLRSMPYMPINPREVDTQRRRARLLGVLVDYFTGLAKHQPVLLQLEDAQWSDPTTLELVDAIVERAATQPLMLIVTARPEFTPTWPRASRVVLWTVRRLGLEESAEVIYGVAEGKPLPQRVVDAILAKGDGIPLFIEELTKERLEVGFLIESGAGWGVDLPISPLSIPATLQDSLTARLDRLGWVKEIAQTAAVIGRDFSPQLLKIVTGLSHDRIAEGLERLRNAQIVVEHGSPPSLTYTFRHALIQDTAYAGLLRSERRALHGIIARFLQTDLAETVRSQPEVLAHHYTEAHEPEQAVIWWRRAGQRSIQAFAYVEAIDQLNRAVAQLEQLPRTEERDQLELELRIDLGVPLIGVGGYTSEALRENVARGIALHGSRRQNASIFPLLAAQIGFAYSGSDIVRATALAEQFLSASEDVGERQLRVIGHWLLGMALTGAACLASARFHLERSLALNDTEQDAVLAGIYGTDPRVAALGYHALVLQQLGLPDAAADSDAASMTRALECGHSATLGYALTLRVCLQMLRGDHAALAASANKLARVAERQSSQVLNAMSGTILSLLHLVHQPDEAGFARVRQTIEGIGAAGWNVAVAWLSLFEAEVCLLNGRIDGARRALDTLQNTIQPRGHNCFLPELSRLRSKLAESEGEPDDIVGAHLQQAMDIAANQGARLAELRSAIDLAELWRSRGRREAGYALLAPLYAWFREGAGTPDVRRAGSLLEKLR